MSEFSGLNFMNKQLQQVFKYAELLVRLQDAQELLDVEGGYLSEKEANDKIEELKIEIRKHMDKHLQNSGVGDRAMTVVNNKWYLRDWENKNKTSDQEVSDDI